MYAGHAVCHRAESEYTPTPSAGGQARQPKAALPWHARCQGRTAHGLDNRMAYEEPGMRRYARLVVLAGLTVGVLCLTAACGGAGSTSSPAAGHRVTPTPSGTAPGPAVSSPSVGPSRSPTVPSASLVTAGPANSAQTAEFTVAANGECGFTSSAGKLLHAAQTLPATTFHRMFSPPCLADVSGVSPYVVNSYCELLRRGVRVLGTELSRRRARSAIR